jgi:phosphate acetyltransferase
MAVRPHLAKLVERARHLPPLAAAVVYPVEPESLQTAVSGAFAGYLAPTLVGPESRIREAATRGGVDISRLPIVDSADDPRAATERALHLVRTGGAAALIRGKLTYEDLLAPVAAPESEVRGRRRLSHAMFVDAPGLASPLVLADAHLNVSPNLAAKRDILQNTVEFVRMLGTPVPRVALLAAKNVPTPAFASTVEAAALKSMGLQRMFGDAIVDGPLTPDVALSADAARQYNVRSEVAGCADVLLAPTLEAATMVLRTLTGVTGGLAAGLVLGAQVPIVLASSTDTLEVRMASCVLASLVAAAAREAALRQAEQPAQAAA